MRIGESKFFLKTKGKRKVPLLFCEESAHTKDLYPKLEALFLGQTGVTEAYALAEAKSWGIKGLKLDLVTAVISFLAKDLVTKKLSADEMITRRLSLLVEAQACRSSGGEHSMASFQEAFAAKHAVRAWTYDDDLFADVGDFRLLPTLSDKSLFQHHILRCNQAFFRGLTKKASSLSRSDGLNLANDELDFKKLEAFLLSHKKASLLMTVRSQGEDVGLTLKYADIRAIFA